MFQLKFSNSLQIQVKTQAGMSPEGSSPNPGKLLNFLSRSSTQTHTHNQSWNHTNTKDGRSYPFIPLFSRYLE